ncbi:MAG TPA: nucleotidyltransferase domain-containing protein, partial [Candidatus Dormibacteraeota bacterium]|nr:nucleotidyltransferase domain-containing protein [Candidatus Dormibacteraeota bacterium]
GAACRGGADAHAPVRRGSLDVWASGRGYRVAWRPRNLRELRFKRGDILSLAAAHGIASVRVFGSVARGDAGPSSDVDLIVDLEPGRGALDVSEFAVDLEDSLGCPVDIIVARGTPTPMLLRALDQARPL